MAEASNMLVGYFRVGTGFLGNRRIERRLYHN